MTFDANYYDRLYFADPVGKEFRRPDGKGGWVIDRWGYRNKDGHWGGCIPIMRTMKEIFNLTNSSKMLDFGCGRGQFISAIMDEGINAEGFDFSEFAVNNPYLRCPKERIRRWDATVRWPYDNGMFDLVIGLDILEHIYLDDIDKVVEEMFRVCKVGGYIFLQIATIGGGSGSDVHNFGYVIGKGDKTPIELEGCAVAGHVTVKDRKFWIDRLIDRFEKLDNGKFRFRDDLVEKFVKRVNKVDPKILDNWVRNTLICIERLY